MEKNMSQNTTKPRMTLNTDGVQRAKQMVFSEILIKSKEEIANIMREGAPLDEDKEFFVKTGHGYEHVSANRSALLIGDMDSPDFAYVYKNSEGHPVLAHKLTDDIKDLFLGEIEKGDYIVIDFSSPDIRSTMDAFAFDDEFTQVEPDEAIAIMVTKFGLPAPQSFLEDQTEQSEQKAILSA